jgi:hypothetical protein
MKRPWIILLTGVALAAAAYFTVYHTTLSCCGVPPEASTSELAWLKHEFYLSDAEFRRISDLHNAYLSGCRERCAKIDAKNAELRAQIAQANAVTPEVERALAEAARLRGECQAAMLRHFVEVSRAMPPEQGRRYLEWICARTLAPQHDSMAPATATAHDHHGM